MTNSAEDTGIQIRIRPPQPSHQKAILDMYRESRAEGENSPLHVALKSSWTEPLPLILSGIFFLGSTVFITTDTTGTTYVCLCTAISSVAGIFLDLRYMWCSYMKFLRDSFESDLGNIVAYYNIEENAANDLDLAVCDMTPWIVGSIALDMSTTPQSDNWGAASSCCVSTLPAARCGPQVGQDTCGTWT